ncbi:hypothetical protein F5880DRAFT_1512252, partial [Lentinula raphanica]
MAKRAAGTTIAKKTKKKARQSRRESSKEEEGNEESAASNGESDGEVVDVTEQAKAAKEAAEAQIKKDLTKRKLPVYAFFDAEPQIEYGKSDTPDYLVYRCTKCGEKLRQGLKTGDRGSTGNLRDHVKKCWGEEALAAIKETTLDQAQKAVRDLSKGKQSTLTAVVVSVRSWFKSFSTRPPAKEKI